MNVKPAETTNIADPTSAIITALRFGIRASIDLLGTAASSQMKPRCAVLEGPGPRTLRHATSYRVFRIGYDDARVGLFGQIFRLP